MKSSSECARAGHKRCLLVACTRLLAYYFLGGRSLAIFGEDLP